MNYRTYEITVADFLDLIEKDKIDLKPSYQRNAVWSGKDQSSLIDTIQTNLPIPNFFLFKKKDGYFEMVDGQQRARAIYGFYKGFVVDAQRRKFQEIDQDQFLAYRLNISELSGDNSQDLIRKFYVLVNKQGVTVNKPEIIKAQYADSKFLELVEALLEVPELAQLDLFTDASTKRMNDRSFIEELVALLKYGISDKKLQVEKMYEEDITSEEYQQLLESFTAIVRKLQALNTDFPVNRTRYKQRNDFYSLFHFLHIKINEETIDTNLYQYQLLRVFERYISPSNEECDAFKTYAINCVSQSNSRKARIERLHFLESTLRNETEDPSPIFKDVYNYLDAQGVIDGLIKVNGYTLFRTR